MRNTNMETLKVNRTRFLTNLIYQCNNCDGYKSEQPKRIELSARCSCGNDKK